MKNKRNLFYIIILITIILIFIVIWFGKPYIKSALVDEYIVRSFEPVICLYDPEKRIDVPHPESIRHYSVIWKNTGVWFNKEYLMDALNKGDVLLTIETWHKSSLTSSTNNVLTETLNGTFDKKIKELGAILSISHHQVFIRWNPDMEVPAYQYPWQFQSPQLYIKSFNYFASHIKKDAPNVKIVWGPSGYPGDTEYWPGSRYVDVAGIAMGSISENYSVADPIHYESASEMLRLKLHRMRFVNKPVLVLGSDKITPATFNKNWLSEVAATMEKYKNTIYSSDNYLAVIKQKPTRKKLLVGVYDANKKLIGEHQITTEHIFTNWGDIQNGEFNKRFNDIILRNHIPIVTMEPWRDTCITKTPPDALTSVLNGQYDNEIKKFFKIISGVKQDVYLRFAHEMEIPIHRYGWQSQDPVKYINAFRYFMHFANSFNNIRKVWGPAGDRGSIDFYPGNDVVDYVSIAIYGLPDKNITDPNKQEAFGNIFSRKIYRMRFINKPIFITEFGVKGPEDYQTNWLKEAAGTINKNDQVFGVCYFNLYDNPKAWGKIKAPDWSISKKSFGEFCKALGLN